MWVQESGGERVRAQGETPVCLFQVFLGGSIVDDGKVKVLEDPENRPQPRPRIIQVPQAGSSETGG